VGSEMCIRDSHEVLQQIDDVVERLKSIDVPVASSAAQHALTAGL